MWNDAHGLCLKRALRFYTSFYHISGEANTISFMPRIFAKSLDDVRAMVRSDKWFARKFSSNDQEVIDSLLKTK